MADLIYTDNPGGLPAEYVLAPAQAIAIQSVRALFDGAGAAASFYPCLTILSQDGKLIARVRTSSAYAIGDTGEVTWAPFLRAPQTVTPAAGATDFAQSSPAVTTSGAGLTTVTFGAWNGIATTTVFGVSAGSNPVLLAEGLYVIFVAVIGGVTAPNQDTEVDLQLNRVGAGGNAVWSGQGPIVTILGFSQLIDRINQAAPAMQVAARTQAALTALVAVTALPVGGYEFNVQIDKLIDGVSAIDTYTVRLTGLYIGPLPP